MSKKRGILSIILLLLILPMMAFFLILFDILRLSQAKQKIELTSNKALEAALVEYDDEIYEKYRLMVIKDKDKARKVFKKALKYANSEKGARPPLSNYKIIDIKLRAGAPLSDRKALKTAIIKKHEKYFIVSSLEKWMKKLEELKKIKPYAKACEAYSDGLSEILKLKKLYYKLGKVYRVIEEEEARVEYLNIRVTIDHIHQLKKEIKELKKSLRELSSQLTGFAPGGGNGVSALNAAIANLNARLAEKEEALKELTDLIHSLLNRNKELKHFHSKLQNFQSKLVSASRKIAKKEEEIENISKEEDVKEAKELIKNLVTKVENAIGELDKIEPKLKEDADYGEKQNRDIRPALNREEAYEGEEEIRASAYAKLSDNEKISTLFGTWDLREGEVEINNIMDLIWLALNGELLPDFSDLSNPDFSKAPHIPSEDKDIKKEHTVKKLLERYSEPKPDAEEFGYKTLEKTAGHSKELADKNLNFDIKTIFEKMVIAGYITDTFNHYSFRDEDKDKFFSGAEVEYILSGSKDTKHNLIMTQLKIFSLRYCLNFVPIALYKADEIDKISLFLSSFTGGLGFPVYKGIVTLAWCSLETLADLKEINEGKGSIIIKSRTDIISSLNSDDSSLKSGGILKNRPQKLKPKGRKKNEDEDEDEGDGKLRMNYEEHLFLFLLIENEDDSLIRIADLIALKENADTRILFTGLEADINYNINPLFPGAKNYLNMRKDKNYQHSLKSISSY